MRKTSKLAAGLGALLLGACGGDGAEPPIEQIVVGEPGETAKGTEAGGQPAAGDLVAAGEKAFAVCSACHAVSDDAPAGPGPNLKGVFGRKAGSLEGFGYSEALAASGLTWDKAELDAFIADPRAKVPGTTMAAGAVTDDERRGAIIAYLESLSE